MPSIYGNFHNLFILAIKSNDHIINHKADLDLFLYRHITLSLKKLFSMIDNNYKKKFLEIIFILAIKSIDHINKAYSKFIFV